MATGSNNLVTCHCAKFCGGPLGQGVPRPYSTFRAHQRAELDGLAAAISFEAPPAALQDVAPVRLQHDNHDQEFVQGASKRPRISSPSALDEGDQADQQFGDQGMGMDVDKEPFGPSHSPQHHSPPPEPPLPIATAPPTALPTADADGDLNGAAPDRGSERDLDREEEEIRPPRQLPVRPQIPPDGPGEEAETDVPNFVPVIEDIRIAQEFIDALRAATLESDIEKLDEELIDRIRNPPQHILSIDNPTERLSIDTFLAIGNASQETYERVRAAIMLRFPAEQMLSFFQVKKLVEKLTGITTITHDMCVDSCVGFTGPFFRMNACPMCGEARYERRGGKQKARKQFQTIPLAPQLQALWRTPEGARSMRYRERYTAQLIAELEANNNQRISPYRDFLDSEEYLDLYLNDQIRSGDMVLVMSMDGAQLYRNKISECWMYIWIVFDHAPEVRYKKRYILPGGFIPGPTKPKNIDSFQFTGLYHLAALQKEGLKIWDADRNIVFESHPFLALGTADGPGMACLSGLVGHQGKVHCRLYCPLKGRHKPQAPQYYPARLKPRGYDVSGCDHPDVDLETLLRASTADAAERRYKANLERVIHSTNPTDFKRRRLETGICKPSILSGLPAAHTLAVPRCFPMDIMHLPALNIPDLFIPLWRGTFECDKTDNKATWDWAVLQGTVWKDHGKSVADATPYLPGSFDRPPRNPYEKISSGYKAWEYLLYFYGLGPCLFFQLLPDKYWRNYCKLVRGVRLLMQAEIYQKEINEAHRKLTEFSDEFEVLYCQRRTDRIHFVRPSIHGPAHWAPETQRLGPGLIYSQWGIERTIGNLGEEIKQHSDPYANLAQRGLRRCQVNALKAMIPDLEPPEKPFPRGALDIGDKFVLLRAMDTAPREVRQVEQDAFVRYDTSFERPENARGLLKVVRWSRLRLPNRQIARSQWKEGLKKLSRLRTSRNIQFRDSDKSIRLAEILFFVARQNNGADGSSDSENSDTDSISDASDALAVISLYGLPNETLLEASSHTYWSVHHLRDTDIRVISVKSILSVVAMVPDLQYRKWVQDGTEDDRWFLVEKPGVKMAERILQDDETIPEEHDED